MIIETRYLRAMLLFVANDDIRHYLNGVYIKGDKMMATNGHYLTVCKLQEDSNLDVIIPTKHVQAAIQLAKRENKFTQPEIEITNERIGDVFYKPIDGKFPDYKKVLPKEFDVMECGAISVNPAYIAKFEKLGLLFNKRHIGISIKAKDESSAMIVHVYGCDDFFSLVMPIKFDKAKFFPDWLYKVEQ